MLPADAKLLVLKLDFGCNATRQPFNVLRRRIWILRMSPSVPNLDGNIWKLVSNRWASRAILKTLRLVSKEVCEAATPALFRELLIQLDTREVCFEICDGLARSPPYAWSQSLPPDRLSHTRPVTVMTRASWDSLAACPTTYHIAWELAFSTLRPLVTHLEIAEARHDGHPGVIQRVFLQPSRMLRHLELTTFHCTQAALAEVLNSH